MVWGITQVLRSLRGSQGVCRYKATRQLGRKTNSTESAAEIMVLKEIFAKLMRVRIVNVVIEMSVEVGKDTACKIVREKAYSMSHE